MVDTANLVPTIDLEPFLGGDLNDKRRVARQLDAACTEIGFFAILGHGVPETLIRRVREMAVAFFALPLEEKMKVQRPPQKLSRGYNWVGDRSLSYSLGKAAPPDIQEAFALGPEHVPDDVIEKARQAGGPVAAMYTPNLWPERPAGFKETILAYFDALAGLRARLMPVMALALGLDEEFFASKFDRAAPLMRLIRYPAVTQPPLPGQLRSGEHTDYGAVTFVRGDDTPGGLQVKERNGGWVEVHPPAGSFTCNLGDLMMRWTNDRWVSTLHRVAVPPPDAVPTDRISLVSFHSPDPDTVISCITANGGEAKYPPVTAAEHYLGKVMKTAHKRLDANVTDAFRAAG